MSESVQGVAESLFFSQFVCNFVHSAFFTFQVRAHCEALERLLVVQGSMNLKTSWHFRLYGTQSREIGHALHPGVQWLQSWPFKEK